MKPCVYVVHEPVDFRRGAASLAGFCQQVLLTDISSGGVFVFRNREINAFKLIFHDGQGLLLLQKRLLKGRFDFWPSSAETFSQFQARQLITLLFNGNPDASRKTLSWLAFLEKT